MDGGGRREYSLILFSKEDWAQDGCTYALKSTSPDVCLRAILTFRMELSGLCLCSL